MGTPRLPPVKTSVELTCHPCHSKVTPPPPLPPPPGYSWVAPPPASPTSWVLLLPPPLQVSSRGRGRGGGHPLMVHHQLGAGLIKKSSAFSIGQSASPCNLDWWTQFPGFTSATVTFPNWVMWVANAILIWPV